MNKVCPTCEGKLGTRFENPRGVFNYSPCKTCWDKGFIENKNPAAVALGSLGGKSKSKAKQIASAQNGKKGGRPKKKLQ